MKEVTMQLTGFMFWNEMIYDINNNQNTRKEVILEYLHQLDSMQSGMKIAAAYNAKTSRTVSLASEPQLPALVKTSSLEHLAQKLQAPSRSHPVVYQLITLLLP